MACVHPVADVLGVERRQDGQPLGIHYHVLQHSSPALVPSHPLKTPRLPSIAAPPQFLCIHIQAIHILPFRPLSSVLFTPSIRNPVQLLYNTQDAVQVSLPGGVGCHCLRAVHEPHRHSNGHSGALELDNLCQPVP